MALPYQRHQKQKRIALPEQEQSSDCSEESTEPKPILV